MHKPKITTSNQKFNPSDILEFNIVDSIEPGAKDECRLLLANHHMKYITSPFENGDLIQASITDEYNKPVILFDQFKIDTISYNNIFNPARVEIRALSIPNQNAQKKQSLTFENQTLAQIVTYLIQQASFIPFIDCPDIQFPNMSIKNESLEQTLKRLAHEYDCVFAIKNKTIIFSKKAYQSAASINLEQYQIAIQYNARKTYSACSIDYYDHTQKELIHYKTSTAPDSETYKLYGIAESLEQAKKQCESELKKQKPTLSGTISGPGQLIYSGAIIKITQFGPLNASYEVKKIDHSLTFGQGWKMRLSIKGV